MARRVLFFGNNIIMSTVDSSRQVPSFLGYLATNQANVLLTDTNPVTAFLIPFLSL